MHHTTMLAIMLPHCANAFTTPGAADPNTGRSRKPVADRGRASPYMRSTAEGSRTKSTGNARIAMQAALATMDIAWVSAKETLCCPDAFVIRPAMKQNSASPSAGRHREDAAWRSISETPSRRRAAPPPSQASAARSGRPPRHAIEAHAIDARKSAASMPREISRSAPMAAYPHRPARLPASTKQYVLREGTAAKARPHRRSAKASAQPRHAPPAANHGRSSAAGTIEKNRRDIATIAKPISEDDAASAVAVAAEGNDQRACRTNIAAKTTALETSAATKKLSCTPAFASIGPNGISP